MLLFATDLIIIIHDEYILRRIEKVIDASTPPHNRKKLLKHIDIGPPFLRNGSDFILSNSIVILLEINKLYIFSSHLKINILVRFRWSNFTKFILPKGVEYALTVEA